ncbi:MAG: N-acetylmuramoyl-L-alanine amidase [Fimbriimonadaceae bacterium]
MWAIAAFAIGKTMTIDWAKLEQEFQFTAPGKNKVAWVDTKNYGERPEDTVIDTIVLHHTASPNLGGTVKWFTMEESQVSCHFTIGKDGSIVQMVSCFDRAWQAGRSSDAYGRSNVNDFSIGIEIVNMGDGKDPYTEDQLEAVENLVGSLIKRFPIKQIVSHEFIADPAGRKNDPINYPWERLERFHVPMYFGQKKS